MRLQGRDAPVLAADLAVPADLEMPDPAPTPAFATEPAPTPSQEEAPQVRRLRGYAIVVLTLALFVVVGRRLRRTRRGR